MQSTSALSTLVNVDRVRSAIRRLFTGEISEILGELLQNSQRARSSEVTITTTENGFTYTDDGHGLLGDIAGFHTLLKIAESHFDNPTLAAQDPMGLGIHALLAHQQVATVRFETGNLGLTIDTGRWWADQAYYATWFERLETLGEDVCGLRVLVQCQPGLRTALQNALTGRGLTTSPAQGYADLLRITLDGAAVDTSLPTWVTRGTVLIETTYQGCPLTIRYADDLREHSAVNWYGQIITDHFNHAFSYYLHVRDGKPVNPLSPSRRGLIKDAAREALIAFIKDQLFAFLFDPANRARIQPAWVSAYYDLDGERALRSAPYFVAAPLTSDFGSFEDVDSHGELQLFAYGDAAPLLLNQSVMVLAEGDEEPQFADYMHGRTSFLPMTGEAYTLLDGNQERLWIGTIWWRPGSRRNDAFNMPGVWGMSFTADEPATWQPVTAATVFALNDPSCWDVDDVDFVAGTTDPIAFYQDAAWAGFDPQHDDYDYDTIRDSYEESCAAHIRKLIGDAIPAKFDLWDIMSKMQNATARITSIRYHYPPRRKSQRLANPIAITARNSAGERKRLKLVA